MSTASENSVVAKEFESELNQWVDMEKKAVDLNNTLGQIGRAHV